MTTYTWDGENRLTKIEPAGGGIYTMTHDATGLRRKKEAPAATTFIIRDGQEWLPVSERTVEIESEDFRDMLRPGAQVALLAGGMRFTEGPVWMDQDQCLLFSDIPANEIKRWSATKGLSTWRSPSGNANGNTVDREERLVTCENSNRRVTRTERDGTITVLATTFDGKQLNAPNDVVVKSDGSIWFTDPTYGVEPEQVEQAHNYVFRLDECAAEPTPVVDDFGMPNGLCFSPDERFLYIADSSDHRHIRRFAVNGDGTLSGGEVFAAISPGVPDGIRVDTQGRVYTTAQDGVHVLSPEGDLLGKFIVPETSANCTFGGPNRQTLFITATTGLYAIELNARGVTHGSAR